MSFDLRARAYEGRHWYPDELADEILPEPRNAPDLWIKRVEGDEVVFFGSEGDQEWRAKIGDVVKFHWTEYRGVVEIVIAADGSWQGGPEPADYNHCWAPFDSDTIAESIGETVKLVLEYGEAGPLSIECSKWNESAELFDLQRVRDGARLVPIGRRQ